MQRFTLYRDSKGTIWRDCFDPKKVELAILAKSEKQAFKLAYDNIAYRKELGWGILPKQRDAIPDPINAPMIDNSPHLDVPACEDCPVCGRPMN